MRADPDRAQPTARRDPLPGSIAAGRPRFIRHNLGHVLAVMRLLRDPAYYAERTLARYVAAHPRLGSSDRAAIGDLVFALVRWRRRIDRAIELATPGSAAPPSGDVAVLLACGALLRTAGYADEVILDAVAAAAPEPLPPGADAWIATAAEALVGLDPNAATDATDLASRASLPEWVVARLVRQYGWARARAIAVASRERAPAVLRINALRTTRADVIAALAREGIAAHPTALSPWGVVLDEPVSLHGSSLTRDGLVEFQDEGSQLVALAAGARPGMRVVDACAGAGGKTLALAAAMEDRGEIIALDVDRAKLDELRRRAARAGATIVRTSRPSAGADLVLVDAPCSGSGTWRRIPDGPWHLAPDDVARHAERQREILSRYASLVRPGGRLVYATCSIFAEENEDVVTRLLAERPDFALCPATEALPADVASLVAEGPYLALTPDRHGTDGFFVAIMERTKP